MQTDRHIKAGTDPFLRFQEGDTVAHISRGDGVVTKNDGRYIEVRFKDGHGKYDTLWFGLYPTWLFHRGTKAAD